MFAYGKSVNSKITDVRIEQKREGSRQKDTDEYTLGKEVSSNG